jgi:hypothetical protein
MSVIAKDYKKMNAAKNGEIETILFDPLSGEAIFQ